MVAGCLRFSPERMCRFEGPLPPGSRTPWRNGSASDSRSEGCVFKSRRGHARWLLCRGPLFFLLVAPEVGKGKNGTKGRAPGEARTHGLQIMRLTLCQLSHRGLTPAAKARGPSVWPLAKRMLLTDKIGLRRPGIEPGSTAWKAAMLTIIPPTLSGEGASGDWSPRGLAGSFSCLGFEGAPA